MYPDKLTLTDGVDVGGGASRFAASPLSNLRPKPGPFDSRRRFSTSSR